MITLISVIHFYIYSYFTVLIINFLTLTKEEIKMIQAMDFWLSIYKVMIF